MHTNSSPSAPTPASSVSQAPVGDTAPETDGPPAPAKRQLSRRSLLRAGAAASPVLLTLASGPVSATGTVNCMVASSFISVATFLSRNPDKTVSCSTKNCEYWQEQARLVPTPADLNLTVAEFLGSTGSSYNSHVLKDVLNNPISLSGTLGVLQHCLSLALSVKGGHVPNAGVINVNYIKTIWSSYNTNHPNYRSPAGVVMTEAQLIDWMRVLMYPLTLP